MKNIQVSPLSYEMVLELCKKRKIQNPKLMVEELIKVAYNQL